MRSTPYELGRAAVRSRRAALRGASVGASYLGQGQTITTTEKGTQRKVDSRDPNTK